MTATIVNLRDYRMREEREQVKPHEDDGEVIHASPPAKDTAPCEIEAPWKEGA